jgi:hypothetical protein
MSLILLFVAFIEILGLRVLILLFMLVFRSEWARKCWSVMDMIRHVSAGPLWTCVKVADYCDPSFAGTLTKIFVSYLA